MRRLLFLVLVLFPAVFGVAQNPGGSAMPPYKNPSLPVEQRVQDLLGRMTLQEKVAMLSGADWMQSVANERLGIPSIKMADGPIGIRSWAGPSSETNKEGGKKMTTTAFPAGVAMAATWDTELLRSEGQAIGQEVKAVGRDMILGPTVNINRTPLWGRNFEGYGEDPYLTGRLAVAYIKGVQGEGVIATVKHFAANNQEFERHRINAVVSERALQEIYFPAFKAAVEEGGVWSVMSAYNKLNGVYCAENSFLLKDVLQKEWGFKGFVVSDWGSTYSTAATVNAGMDLEMPGGEPMQNWLKNPRTQAGGNGGGWLVAEKVLAEISAGKISAATIDDNVGRILRVIFVSGQFDKPHSDSVGDIDTPEQRAVARKAATESIVLLKNAGDLLPLDAAKIHSLVVIGPNAAVARTGGGGSSLVVPKYSVTPLKGIQDRAGQGVQVSNVLGVAMEGEDASKDTAEAREQLRNEAVNAAAKADAAVIVVGRSPKLESEGFDIKSLDLPGGQDELIEAVAKVNQHTVVVINAGGPVIMSKWIAQVPAIVDMWYGGQEGGNAIADVLFGQANPSGKLPVSFVKEWKDSPAYGHYPGENLQVDYAEGIYVGYRYFDKQNVEPLFPFGYGLSYTKFSYSDLKISPNKAAPGQPVEVNVRVRNSGSRSGAEVVELYVHDGHASVDRPVRELKGFQRVDLAAGETKEVHFTLDRGAMAFYSTAKKDWVTEPGEFEILIGSSSRDLRMKGSFVLRP
jgi:beta-glucosidase